MKKLFLSSLFLIFFIISCGSPSECECKKEFERSINNYSYNGSELENSLLLKCMEVYKDASFVNANCDNDVSVEDTVKVEATATDAVEVEADSSYVEYEGYD